MTSIEYMIDLQARLDDYANARREAGDTEGAMLIIEARRSAYRHWSDLNRIRTITGEERP